MTVTTVLQKAPAGLLTLVRLHAKVKPFRNKNKINILIILRSADLLEIQESSPYPSFLRRQESPDSVNTLLKLTAMADDITTTGSVVKEPEGANHVGSLIK